MSAKILLFVFLLTGWMACKNRMPYPATGSSLLNNAQLSTENTFITPSLSTGTEHTDSLDPVSTKQDYPPQKTSSERPHVSLPVRTDTLYTPQEKNEILAAEDKISERVKKMEIGTVIAVVLVIITAVAAGFWATGNVGIGVYALLVSGLIGSFGLALNRLRNIIRFNRQLKENTPELLAVDNPFLNELLQKRMRLLYNALYLFPIGSLMMAIQIKKRLKKDATSQPEVTAYVQRLSTSLLLLSLLSLAIWSYLFWASFPFLISVLIG
jgi:hypothetical protein